jgi:hypothetical protein
MAHDATALRIVYQQLRAVRQAAEAIDPTEADRRGDEGSGISVLIRPFNLLLDRTKALLHEAPPGVLEAIDGISHVEQIDESLLAKYHKIARQQVIMYADLLLEAISPLMVTAAGAPLAVTVEREGAFLAGQQFDALRVAAGLVVQAANAITLIDGYVDDKVLALLTSKREHVTVNLLTKASVLPAHFKVMAVAFNQQYGQKGKLSVRTSEKFHDRFLIVDNDYYHFGASLKDLGKRGFMFSRIEEPSVVATVQGAFTAEWGTAPVVV